MSGCGLRSGAGKGADGGGGGARRRPGLGARSAGSAREVSSGGGAATARPGLRARERGGAGRDGTAVGAAVPDPLPPGRGSSVTRGRRCRGGGLRGPASLGSPLGRCEPGLPEGVAGAQGAGAARPCWDPARGAVLGACPARPPCSCPPGARRAPAGGCYEVGPGRGFPRCQRALAWGRLCQGRWGSLCASLSAGVLVVAVSGSRHRQARVFG